MSLQNIGYGVVDTSITFIQSNKLAAVLQEYSEPEGSSHHVTMPSLATAVVAGAATTLMGL